jgi:hypothetical protein
VAAARAPVPARKQAAGSPWIFAVLGALVIAAAVGAWRLLRAR